MNANEYKTLSDLYQAALKLAEINKLDADRYRTTLLAIKHELEGQQVWVGTSWVPVYLHPIVFNNVLVPINEALTQKAGDTK